MLGVGRAHPQREGSQRNKKGKTGPWGQRQVQCHLTYGHVPTCIKVQGKYKIPLGVQPPDLREGLCMLLSEMKGVTIVKRLMSGTWTFSGAGKGWGGWEGSDLEGVGCVPGLERRGPECWENKCRSDTGSVIKIPGVFLLLMAVKWPYRSFEGMEEG